MLEFRKPLSNRGKPMKSTKVPTLTKVLILNHRGKSQKAETVLEEKHRKGEPKRIQKR
jgi:hypothetical protein